MTNADRGFFEAALHKNLGRPGDERSIHQRERARVIHAAGFRRLQGKTQVMGVGEGDFHRTRLTHSIECAQIGYGILTHVEAKKGQHYEKIGSLFPGRDLIETACFAHDLGHPPFGHGGETALHKKMHACGGFEGNGQTLRILSRLEKYREPGKGLYPSRRLVLAVLKYPAPYSAFDAGRYKSKPPKCFYDEEADIVAWAMEGFSQTDRELLENRGEDDRPKHHTLDCSIMELADDIAYGIHDIEDIVARGLASESDVRGAISGAFDKIDGNIRHEGEKYDAKAVSDALFGSSYSRKQMVSALVNMFVTAAELQPVSGFAHPLLAFNVGLPETHRTLLKQLKKLAHGLVIRHPKVQQLERRGQRVVSQIFDELMDDPEQLIPESSRTDLQAAGGCLNRCVCDYVAGMTDSYAEKVFHRLFTPGYGSSGDEL